MDCSHEIRFGYTPDWSLCFCDATQCNKAALLVGPAALALAALAALLG